MPRNLPNGWECNLDTCQHHDPIGSENSCCGGTLTQCPIASGFMSEVDEEAREIGLLVLQNDDLTALHAYLAGKKRGTSG